MLDYVLESSINNNETVTIMYLKRNNEITQRNIKIIKIKDNDIEAYCYLRHQLRHFKKNNILSAFNIQK